MGLNNLFKPEGRGVIATADTSGTINTAVYSAPRVIDETTVAWGMSDGRTYRNLLENPNAAYLYMDSFTKVSGVRLTLSLKEIKNDGALLDEIKDRTAEVVSGSAAQAITHVAYFTVTETRSLL